MNRIQRNVFVAAIGGAFSLAGVATAQQSESSPQQAQQTQAQGQSQSQAQGQTQARSQASRDVRASQVIGAEVRNPQGEKLGNIEDLVVDMNAKQMRYAVLSHGGILGVGNKFFAYPVKSLRLDRDGQALVLDVPRERLENAPGFEKDRWPDFNERSYRGEVDRYHGSTGAGASERLVRVKEMLGSDLRASSGDRDAGELKDIVFDLSAAKIRYAVVEVDRAWRDADRRTTAATTTPPGAAQTTPGLTSPREPTAPATDTRATDAQSGTTARSDASTATPDRATDTTATTGGAMTSGTAGSTDTTARGDTTARSDTATAPGETRPVPSASPPQNDPQRRADGAAARTGGDLHAVPIDALQLPADGRDRMVLNIDPQRLPADQGFDERQLDNLNDPAFERRVQRQIQQQR